MTHKTACPVPRLQIMTLVYALHILFGHVAIMGYDCRQPNCLSVICCEGATTENNPSTHVVLCSNLSHFSCFYSWPALINPGHVIPLETDIPLYSRNRGHESQAGC